MIPKSHVIENNQNRLSNSDARKAKCFFTIFFLNLYTFQFTQKPNKGLNFLQPQKK